MIEKKFSTNLSFILTTFLALNLLALIVHLTSKRSDAGFGAIYFINAATFLLYFFKRNIVALDFRKDEVEITYWKMLFKRKEIYKYEDIYWSNRKTLIGKGNIGHILKLYYNEKTIASLHRASSGFDQEAIDEIHKVIIANNIKHESI